MTLPKRVKVGFHNYKIKPMSEAFVKKHHCRGFHCGPKEIIRIDLRTSRKHVAQTLLHELLHAVYFVYDILEEIPEEATINPLSTGLACLWNDNPEVMKWIHKELTS